LAEVVKARASDRSGIAKVSLIDCAAAAEVAPIFEALSELAGMSPEQRILEPTHLLRQIDINWAGNEVLFVQLLKLRESYLALAVVEQVHHEWDCPLGILEIGPIEWWLDWLVDESDPWSRHWLKERLSWLFASYVSKETRHAFVNEFNKAASKYRGVLADSILLKQNELTTDDFSADAISFLLADLERTELKDSWRGHLLGNTATEKFVAERLLPLVSEAKDLLLKNLQKVLQQAGSRHGRRYLID